jgi:hypothetical protein
VGVLPDSLLGQGRVREAADRPGENSPTLGQVAFPVMAVASISPSAGEEEKPEPLPPFPSNLHMISIPITRRLHDGF